MDILSSATRKTITRLTQDLIWAYSLKIHFCKTEYSVLRKETSELSYHLFFATQAAAALHRNHSLINVLTLLTVDDKFKLSEQKRTGNFSSIKEILEHAIQQEKHIEKICDELVIALEKTDIELLRDSISMKLECNRNISKLQELLLYPSSGIQFPQAIIT